MNLKDALKTVSTYFSPKIIGEVNDQYIKVKIKGRIYCLANQRKMKIDYSISFPVAY
jgi:hypothetical protein